MNQLRFLSVIFIFVLTMAAGLNSGQALETVVVGQPYYYAPVGYGFYGPYAPIAYPGLNDQPNPALRGGGLASNPYFLGIQSQRATGVNPGPAFGASGFLLEAPQPGLSPATR